MTRVKLYSPSALHRQNTWWIQNKQSSPWLHSLAFYSVPPWSLCGLTSEFHCFPFLKRYLYHLYLYLYHLSIVFLSPNAFTEFFSDQLPCLSPGTEALPFASPWSFSVDPNSLAGNHPWDTQDTAWSHFEWAVVASAPPKATGLHALWLGLAWITGVCVTSASKQQWPCSTVSNSFMKISSLTLLNRPFLTSRLFPLFASSIKWIGLMDRLIM